MKIKLDQINEGEEEIIIRYRKMTEELSNIVAQLNARQKKIVGILDKKQYLLNPESIYYFESVDNIVFAYTEDAVYRTIYNLGELETMYKEYGYFRCNKSCVINVYMVFSLKSEMGNRIDATLNNGEHIIISRRYAKEFRLLLQG